MPDVRRQASVSSSEGSGLPEPKERWLCDYCQGGSYWLTRTEAICAACGRAFSP